jgi:hypothetical protein
MIPVLNEYGTKCAVVGNHDFDFGVSTNALFYDFLVLLIRSFERLRKRSTDQFSNLLP